jgi:hypothetical protein
MERKLASIQRITNLQLIDGADKIMKATVLGWEVVVLKEDFNVNDLCVYCEIDTILPDKPEFAFLKERKFRIRTIRLKSQVSQGICFPLSILPKGKYSEGDDITEKIGAKKYDPQAEAEQKEIDRLNAIHKNRIRKYFMRYSWFRRLVFRSQRLPRPSFVRKTDEDRIQLFPNICQEQKGTKFHITEKLDGTSASFFVVKKGWRYKYGICSRNFEIIKKQYPYWDVSEKYGIKESLIELAKEKGEDIVIQGEIIGPKVQENKYKLNELQFYVFNLKIGNQWYFHPIDICANFSNLFTLNFEAVPLVDYGYCLPNTINEAVEYARGESVLADIPREGIVVRNQEKGLSFKIINPDFLLKYDA